MVSEPTQAKPSSCKSVATGIAVTIPKPYHRDLMEFTVQPLLATQSVEVRDVYCAGTCRHRSAEECAGATQLVFPYRGAYVRHLGSDDAVAEASQVLFFNPDEGYRVSHPIRGGDASLDMKVDESLLRELTPKALLRDGANVAFRMQR